MSDDELHRALEEKYGRDWEPAKISVDDPLAVEFFDRISRGSKAHNSLMADKEMQDLLNSYTDMFQQNFPFFVVRLPDKELKRVLKECIQSNKPYELDARRKAMIDDPKICF